MAFEELSTQMLVRLETALKAAIARIRDHNLEPMRQMLAYHMGWEGEDTGPRATGKRIRPLLVLLTNAGANGAWEQALPAAVAIELIHNFSLIHDDIQDNSPLRRGRPTVWKLWGMPQAINAGDAMLTLAHLSLLELGGPIPAASVLRAARLLQETCLSLTKGQYLDIAYEARGNLDLEAYWPMVSGKTAALLATCTEVGPLVAGADATCCAAYREFGHSLGLAFQAQDDLLGIWGDASLTGKSAESDLLTGKKSLPVLYGLSLNGAFARAWQAGPIQAEDVPKLAIQLKDEGAFDYTVERANRLTDQALKALDLAHPHGEAGEALRALALRLLNRPM
ncbi:MAG: polyprenyl synthetase family protein [Anaerolineales bacterium]|jgi:geranylgeranyl diphosphate synthase type I